MIGYPGTVTKRLIDIDDGLERQVRALLGTGTLKDTVNGALAEVILLRRERVAIALDYFAGLSREGVLEDRERAW